MATLKRVRVNWTGWPGGPGVSTYYFDPAGDPPLAALRTLWMTHQGIIASGIVLQIENAGQEIDVATGKAVGSWAGPAQAPITAAGGGTYAAPVGGMVSWRSGIFFNGRQVTGKTFLVPMSSNAYDSSGTLLDANRTSNDASLATFLNAAPGLRIWSRRSAASVSVSSARLVDKAVVMRSRRD